MHTEGGETLCTQTCGQVRQGVFGTGRMRRHCRHKGLRNCRQQAQVVWALVDLIPRGCENEVAVHEEAEPHREDRQVAVYRAHSRGLGPRQGQGDGQHGWGRRGRIFLWGRLEFRGGVQGAVGESA